MQMKPSQSWVMFYQSEDLHETLHALVCKSSEDSRLPSSQKQIFNLLISMEICSLHSLLSPVPLRVWQTGEEHICFRCCWMITGPCCRG